MKRFFRPIWFLIIPFFISGCGLQTLKPEKWSATPSAGDALIRVTVTSQGYYFHRPWQQRRPKTQTAIGVVVPGNRVLVPAVLVANHRYIELETIDSRQKHRAEVDVVDYEANLALLKPMQDSFLAHRIALELGPSISTGQDLTIWQVKPNGDVVPTKGKVTSIELTAYTANNYFLSYRLNAALQYRFNNLTLPVLNGNTLAGLVLRNNPSGRTIDVIATSVIRHFLTDARQSPYHGFPRAGFRYGPTLDPQLRRYIGLSEDITGIYVQKVIKGGPADRAGLLSGDVITRMGEHPISNTGQFEHPQYGQTSLVHLIRTDYHVDDKMRMQVIRDGKSRSLEVVLDHRRPDEFLVPPYIIDAQPEYLIVGGLVFQELSLSYLREYGKDWMNRAPIHLLYYNQNQDYLNGDQREKIVIITRVIPTPFTIGYENLTNLVVLAVNGRPTGNLKDVQAALNTPQAGFHRFELEQAPGLLFLDPEEIPQIHEVIRQRYRIPISSIQGLGPNNR